MSVPLAMLGFDMTGGVVSTLTIFAKVTYCISVILSEKSQVFVPVLYVPVEVVTPVANTPSISAKSMRGALKPDGIDGAGKEILTVPRSPFFS